MWIFGHVAKNLTWNSLTPLVTDMVQTKKNKKRIIFEDFGSTMTSLARPLRVGVVSSYLVGFKYSWVLQNHRIWACYDNFEWVNQWWIGLVPGNFAFFDPKMGACSPSSTPQKNENIWAVIIKRLEIPRACIEVIPYQFLELCDQYELSKNSRIKKVSQNLQDFRDT